MLVAHRGEPEVTTKESPGDNGDGSYIETITRPQVGDARFLDTIVGKCVGKRMELLNLTRQPERETTPGVPIGVVEVVVKTREEAAKVLSYQEFEGAVVSPPNPTPTTGT